MVDSVTWASTEISPEQFEQRRAGARSHGYAMWLWPDVETGRWRSALKEIVSVTRSVLAGDSGGHLACDDARAMSIAAYTSGMGPLLGSWIESGRIGASVEIAEMLQLHLAHNRRRMTRLTAILRDTVEQLSNGNVSPLLLKGMDTASRYFPEPGVRPLSDIDMYIPINIISQAEQILSRLKYQRAPRTRAPYACDWIDPHVSASPRTLTMVHEDDPWSIDILGSLDKRVPTGARISFDSPLARARLTELPEIGRAHVMPQPLLTLYLAVHFSQTLLNATILRALELVLVIRRDVRLGTLDWEDLVRDAKEMGGLRFIYPALVFVEQLAPGAIPSGVMTAAATDASKNSRRILAGLTLAEAQPLDRHSIRERFMWAADWQDYLVQIGSELTIDGRGVPLNAAVYSIGTKLWALRRRRYSS
jgi:hypothetical protein